MWNVTFELQFAINKVFTEYNGLNKVKQISLTADVLRDFNIHS